MWDARRPLSVYRTVVSFPEPVVRSADQAYRGVHVKDVKGVQVGIYSVQPTQTDCGAILDASISELILV